MGNTQIKVETRWAHSPSGLQPIGNKKTPQPMAHCVSTSCSHFMSISWKIGIFLILNLPKNQIHKKNFKNPRQFFSFLCSFQLYYFLPSWRCGSSVWRCGSSVNWVPNCKCCSPRFKSWHLLSWDCNTATGGQEHWVAIGLHGLTSSFWPVA